ncbi:MAG: hypothetical protein LUQ71_08690 [Methanoregula sp.]|nr:hypothetical protein [Methanoregula sp.]
MDKTTKRNLSLFAFVLITFYCMMTNYWILWAGIVLMLFADNTLDSLKEWLDIRQERYLAAMKDTSTSTGEKTGARQSIQQSLGNIELRLEKLEGGK